MFNLSKKNGFKKNLGAVDFFDGVRDSNSQNGISVHTISSNENGK